MTGRAFLQGAMTPQTQDDKIAAAVYQLGFTPYNGLVDMLKIRANPDVGYIKIGNRFYTYDARTTNPSKLESVLGPLQQGKTSYENLNDPGSVLKPMEPAKSEMAANELTSNLIGSLKKGEGIDTVGTLQNWQSRIPRTKIQDLLRSLGIQDSPQISGGGPGGAGTYAEPIPQPYQNPTIPSVSPGVPTAYSDLLKLVLELRAKNPFKNYGSF